MAPSARRPLACVLIPLTSPALLMRTWTLAHRCSLSSLLRHCPSQQRSQEPPRWESNGEPPTFVGTHAAAPDRHKAPNYPSAEGEGFEPPRDSSPLTAFEAAAGTQNLSDLAFHGGHTWTRTRDRLRVMQVRYRLRHMPVGERGLEPPRSCV